MSDGLILGVMILGGVSLFWICLTYFINTLSGWKVLAKHYAYAGDMPPNIIKFQSAVFFYARISLAQYGGAIHFAVDETYLYMSIFKPLGFFEKKLRIPFEEVTKQDEIQTRVWPKKISTRFSARQCPRIKFALEQKLTARLETHWGALSGVPKRQAL